MATTQRVLTLEQLEALGTRIEQDYDSAKSDHERRIVRWARYYQRWRNRVDSPRLEDSKKSNFSVPLIQWEVLAKLAREVSALFGRGAEVMAEPIGPSDQRIVHKVGRWMTWRVFRSMRAMNDIVVFLFRKVLFGRAFAYMPWHADGWFSGPKWFNIWPDDLIVPAEDVESIQDFSWVIRRFRATPYDLLKGEREGRYIGITENLNEIRGFAENKQQREQDQQIRNEADLAEGVIYEGSLSGRGILPVWEWHGYLDEETADRVAVVVRFLPDIGKVVSVQDLNVLYPKMRYKRPFIEASLIKDGSYWSMGFGEMLESIEDELTVNHRLFDDAGQFTVGPVIFAKPGSGIDASKPIKYEPCTVNWSEDPGGINAVQIRFDPAYSVQKENMCLAIKERVNGQSDQTMGRAIDRPNAPRTARGQIALLEEGNIRASLDIEVLREDFGIILGRIWELDSEFCSESEFFRVTEEEAGGLFDVSRGGAEMTEAERGGRYDFSIKFATSVYSREAEKERKLMLYQLDLSNPLIATNPRALWMVTNSVHKAMGDDNFSDLVPEPPDLGLPKNPREEWALLLQGEEAPVNPADNDQLHLVAHMRQLEEEKGSARRDESAIEALIGHILEQRKQAQQKALMQSMVQSLTESLASNTEQTGGLTMQRPGVPVSMFGLQDTLQQLFTPAEPGEGGQPQPGAPPMGGPQQ